MVHAHGVWRMRIEYGESALSMAYAHGVWRMRMEDGAFVSSMAYAYGVSMAHACGVFRIRMGV